jgi:DNA-3-methyladenine glycosylase II
MTANMTITTSQMKRIVADLATRDARIAKVIDAHPLCTIGRNPKPVSHFEALVESVISQQLAVKAAETIYGRVKGLAQGSTCAHC